MTLLHEKISDTAAAEGLGVASLVIGLTEFLLPKKVEEMLGLEDRSTYRGILRVLGIREILHGVGILTGKEHKHVTTGLWSRVTGDALDTALLGVAATKTKRPMAFAAVSLAVLGIGLADAIYAKRFSS
jgi:hypothetical protein